MFNHTLEQRLWDKISNNDLAEIKKTLTEIQEAIRVELENPPSLFAIHKELKYGFVYHATKKASEEITIYLFNYFFNTVHSEFIQLLNNDNRLLFCAADRGFTQIFNNYLNAISGNDEQLKKQNIMRKLNSVSLTGQAPLFIAARKGHLDIVKLALENGADFNIYSNEMYSAFDIAVINGHVNVAAFLLENIPQARQEINRKHAHDNTLLHHVCHSKASELVKLLLSYGADTTQKNINKKTPLDFSIILLKASPMDNCLKQILLDLSCFGAMIGANLPEDIAFLQEIKFEDLNIVPKFYHLATKKLNTCLVSKRDGEIFISANELRKELINEFNKGDVIRTNIILKHCKKLLTENFKFSKERYQLINQFYKGLLALTNLKNILIDALHQDTFLNEINNLQSFKQIPCDLIQILPKLNELYKYRQFVNDKPIRPVMLFAEINSEKTQISLSEQRKKIILAKQKLTKLLNLIEGENQPYKQLPYFVTALGITMNILSVLFFFIAKKNKTEIDYLENKLTQFNETRTINSIQKAINNTNTFITVNISLGVGLIFFGFIVLIAGLAGLRRKYIDYNLKYVSIQIPLENFKHTLIELNEVLLNEMHESKNVTDLIDYFSSPHSLKIIAKKLKEDVSQYLDHALNSINRELPSVAKLGFYAESNASKQNNPVIIEMSERQSLLQTKQKHYS